MTATTTRERVRRYIVVNESDRIVATCGGTHRMMERICARLDARHGGFYSYDDASEASRYLPQVGPNLALNAR